MRRRKNRWTLPLAAVGGLTVTILLIWLAARSWPFFIDWVLYPDVDGQCEGVFEYDGPEEIDSGRHCFLGPTTHQNEEGFALSTEFATSGWLLAYGRGQLTMRGESNPLHIALFRAPGQSQPWHCASEGELWRGDASRFELQKVSEIVAEDAEGELSLKLKMTASGKIVSGKLGDRDFGSGRLWGTSCLQGERRCTLQVGHQNSLVQITVRTWIGMRTADHREIPIEEALIIFEEGRSPHRLEIATAGSGRGSTIAWASDSDLLTLKINGLTAPAACPAETPGAATIQGTFTP